MNSFEAKTILLAWRPGQRDDCDAETAEALEQARRDPALQHWLEKHSVFQRTMRQAFQSAPVPAGLRDQILERAEVVRPGPWRRRPLVLAAAAAITLLVGGALWLKTPPQDTFQTFRRRMVSAAARGYEMDLVTNDLTVIRQFLSTNNAPADFVLPESLARLPVLGAGLLSWQDQRVSMVCLNSIGQGTLFLFIVDRSAVKHPPPSKEEFVQVNKLMTASWTQGERSYLLAGQEGQETMQRRF